MRETGELTKHYKGDPLLAARYVGVARTLLGRMKAALAGATGARQWVLADGAVIRTIALPNGQSKVLIDVQRVLTSETPMNLHGIACIPCSENAPQGWGKPVPDDDPLALGTPRHLGGSDEIFSAIYSDGPSYPFRENIPVRFIRKNDLSLGDRSWVSIDESFKIILKGNGIVVIGSTGDSFHPYPASFDIFNQSSRACVYRNSPQDSPYLLAFQFGSFPFRLGFYSRKLSTAPTTTAWDQRIINEAEVELAIASNSQLLGPTCEFSPSGKKFATITPSGKIFEFVFSGAVPNLNAAADLRQIVFHSENSYFYNNHRSNAQFGRRSTCERIVMALCLDYKANDELEALIYEASGTTSSLTDASFDIRHDENVDIRLGEISHNLSVSDSYSLKLLSGPTIHSWGNAISSTMTRRPNITLEAGGGIYGSGHNAICNDFFLFQQATTVGDPGNEEPSTVFLSAAEIRDRTQRLFRYDSGIFAGPLDVSPFFTVGINDDQVRDFVENSGTGLEHTLPVMVVIRQIDLRRPYILFNEQRPDLRFSYAPRVPSEELPRHFAALSDSRMSCSVSYTLHAYERGAKTIISEYQSDELQFSGTFWAIVGRGELGYKNTDMTRDQAIAQTSINALRIFRYRSDVFFETRQRSNVLIGEEQEPGILPEGFIVGWDRPPRISFPGAFVESLSNFDPPPKTEPVHFPYHGWGQSYFSSYWVTEREYSIRFGKAVEPSSYNRLFINGIERDPSTTFGISGQMEPFFRSISLI